MGWTDALIVIGAGFGAGFINTLAGGGSLITLPVLIFLGLPPAIANASNRVAIFAQNIFGVLGFKSKGVSAFPFSIWLSVSALLGAILGAELAIEIKGEIFNKILAVVMIVVVFFTIFSPNHKPNEILERTGKKHTVVSVLLFFLVGIWGGFIQAGVGFLIIAILTTVNRFSLVKSNSIKVFVVLVYTVSALAVFIIGGKVNWLFGLVLAVGNSFGGWVASRWSVEKGDKWVRVFLVITVIALAVRLWFFG
jgi:uncharacterized protein